LVGRAHAAGPIGSRKLDDQRLEAATVAAMYRDNFSRARRCEAYPRELLVFEEQLATPNIIADLHMHRGTKARIVGRDECDAARCIVVFDAVSRLARDRKIEPFLRSVNSHSLGARPGSVTYESFNATKELELER
jgi:hypothetical protein